MYFDIDKWLMDLIDDNIQIKKVKIVCDEINHPVSGIAIDEFDNEIWLSSRNARIVADIIAHREEIPLKEFLKVNDHHLVEFVRIEESEIIKKIYLVINNDTIYKMLIIDNKGTKREIIDDEEQQKLLEKFAIQHAVKVSDLKKRSFTDLEIKGISDLITGIDVIVDEWTLSKGPCVEKIVVTNNSGKKTMYRTISDIRRIFIEFCHQEYPDSNDSIRLIRVLNIADRSGFIENIKDLPNVKVIKPIYERIEIIERSSDCHLLPTKVKIITTNHGIQIYDLVNGAVIYDTNFNDNLIKENIIRRIINKKNKNLLVNNSLFETEKYISLLVKYMEKGEFDLENSFFLKYFATQQLALEGITKDTVSFNEFLKKLEEKQSELVNDSIKVVSLVTYQRAEILEWNYNQNSNKDIFKIRVITSNDSFVVSGFNECQEFLQKFAKIKKVDLKTLLTNSPYLIDVSENNVNIDKKAATLEKNKPKLTLRSINIKRLIENLSKFKLQNFDVFNVKEKKVHR